MRYDVVVIGAGLAGSSAAIQLAERGHRVALFEKQTYPAHKLCGEFLSVEVLGMLDTIGVRDDVLAAGAHPIRRAVLTSMDGGRFEAALPGTALGLSRYTLDHLLFERARRAGVDARDGVAVRDVSGNLAEGFRVTTADGATVGGRVVLGAYGKRDTLDRKLTRPFLERTSPFVGFKAHYTGIDLPNVIELHAFPGGYCGLSRVEGGRVNVCWISHANALRDAGGRPEGMIDSVMGRNPYLQSRFAAMRRVHDTFLAVSQVRFSPKSPWANDVCMIGDTAGMIAPMCGDGMAMALRSAQLAVPQADAYLRGDGGREAFVAAYRRAWSGEFGLRMRLGKWMHHAYCRPHLARIGIDTCRYVPALGRWLIRRTRGEATENS